MALLPPDFKEFLRLLNSHEVEYLLVGGYAVAFHGYPRATADMDIWIARSESNAKSMTEALREFGFETEQLTPSLFLNKDNLIRMGLPPLRIEVHTEVSGVSFEECHRKRVVAEMDGIQVSMIGLDDLKANKKASGRYRDLDDLQHLP
jgi:predicted nucleotidyltransferase